MGKEYRPKELTYAFPPLYAIPRSYVPRLFNIGQVNLAQ